MMHVGIKHPVRLEVVTDVDPTDFENVALEARGNDGSRITIIASRQRLRDALDHPKSQREQVEAMFVRDEIDVDTFEAEIGRELSRGPSWGFTR